MQKLYDISPLISVSERDMDLLFLEELTVSTEFCLLFACAVYEDPKYKEKLGTWHSVSIAGLGESDLIHVYTDEWSRKRAILIENKINAQEADSQGNRYLKRGEAGVADGNWDEYKTCMVAPKLYLESKESDSVYSGVVQYEAILDYFKRNGVDDARFKHKASVTKHAISQHRRGYNAVVHPDVSRYVKDYVEYAQANFPSLNVEQYKDRGPTSDWINFRCVRAGSSVDVVHQNIGGGLKIMFKDKRILLTDMQNKYEGCIPELSVYETKTGTIILNLPVESIDTKVTTFESCEKQIYDNLRKLNEIVDLVRSNGDI
jgi:hypothetical protein